MARPTKCGAFRLFLLVYVIWVEVERVGRCGVVLLSTIIVIMEMRLSREYVMARGVGDEEARIDFQISARFYGVCFCGVKLLTSTCDVRTPCRVSGLLLTVVVFFRRVSFRVSWLTCFETVLMFFLSLVLDRSSPVVRQEHGKGRD